jgi:hypothetical protein
MTVYTILQIIGISLLIVVATAVLDAIPGYLREKKAVEAEQRSLRALELARQTESTIAIKVVEPVKSVKHHGKHRYLAA